MLLFILRSVSLRRVQERCFRVQTAVRCSSSTSTSKSAVAINRYDAFVRGVRIAAIGACLYHVVTNYFVEVVQCKGRSMEPTILDGELFIAEHMSTWKKFNSLHKHDVVAVKHPNDPNYMLCKRIIYKEGDEAAVDRFDTPRRMTIPRGHLWLEGDNKPVSVDSRNFGAVSQGLVVARLVFRLWPISRWGSISTHYFFEKNDDA